MKTGVPNALLFRRNSRRLPFDKIHRRVGVSRSDRVKHQRLKAVAVCHKNPPPALKLYAARKRSHSQNCGNAGGATSPLSKPANRRLGCGVSPINFCNGSSISPRNWQTRYFTLHFQIPYLPTLGGLVAVAASRARTHGGAAAGSSQRILTEVV